MIASIFINCTVYLFWQIIFFKCFNNLKLNSIIVEYTHSQFNAELRIHGVNLNKFDLLVIMMDLPLNNRTISSVLPLKDFFVIKECHLEEAVLSDVLPELVCNTSLLQYINRVH